VIEIQLRGLERSEQLPKQLERARERMQNEIAVGAPRAMAAVTPKGRRGQLARGWRARRVGADTIRLENTQPGAAALDVDRVIRPRNRTYLRFPREDGQGFVYTKGPIVQRGAHYLQHGLQLVDKTVERAFDDSFGNVASD
jgi:hypothetical protein